MVIKSYSESTVYKTTTKISCIFKNTGKVSSSVFQKKRYCYFVLSVALFRRSATATLYYQQLFSEEAPLLTRYSSSAPFPAPLLLVSCSALVVALDPALLVCIFQALALEFSLVLIDNKRTRTQA